MAGFGAKVTLSVDRSAASKKQFNDQISSMINQVKISNKFVVLKKDMKTVCDQMQAGLDQYQIKIKNIDCSAAVKSLRTQLQNVINSLSIKNGVTITGLVDPSGAGTISTKIDDIATAAKTGQEEVSRFNAQMTVLKETMKALSSTYQSALPGKSNGITDSAELEAITKRYTELKTAIENVSSSGKIYTSDYVDGLRQEAISIQTTITALQQKQIEQAKASAQDANAEKEVVTLTAGTKEYNNAVKQATDLLARITKAQTEWTAAKNGKSSADYANLEAYATALQNLLDDFQKAPMPIDEFRQRLSLVNAGFAQSASNIKSAGEATKTFGERFGSLTQKFTTWLSVSQLVMLAVRSIKQMVSAVVEVDTAITELKKVTDETDAVYSRFLDNAATRAKTLGATLADTITATADFARLGYSISEASDLANAALVYKNVGDGIEDITDASESVISTMRAFDMEASESMFIVDKFNEVGNNFAISSKGVGDALMNSASSMAAANNTLDETIALITAANSVIQDPDKVGTALKTVSMYLRAASTEAEEAGESTEGMAASVSELRAELLSLTGGVVDIQLDSTSFKSTYEILRELSAVWDDLTDLTQANILELIGGKRNSNVVSAMISNFEIAEDVITTAANATGSALAENEKYLDSIAGRIAVFKAAFEDLSSTLVDSDLVKGIVSFGTTLLSILTAVTDKVGLLGSVGIATLIAGISKFTKSVGRPKMTGFTVPTYALVATRNELAA